MPFKLYKISNVNIYADNLTSKTNSTILDSVSFNNFNLYSISKLKYRPKAITDAIFISKGSTFSDTKTTLTSRSLGGLRVFNYPLIQYIVDPKDENSLITNIYLSPRPKLSFGYNFDFTHSTIQDIGITASTSVSIRNIFRGAETLEISARGNIGSSKEVSNINNKFFNVSEYGFDVKLHLPRVFFPIKTERIIPKSMLPSTSIALGYIKQENIGLDKQNFTSSLNYNWNIRENIKARLELLNIQFVKNVNTRNYFNIYKSSYYLLNTLAQNPSYAVNPNYFNSNQQLIIEDGTNGFTNDVLGPNPTIIPSPEDYKTIRSIEERRSRLTENDLIVSTSYNYSENTKKDQNDNDFMIFRGKIESAGNLLSLLARASKQLNNQESTTKFFEVEYSQYFKVEGELGKQLDSLADVVTSGVVPGIVMYQLILKSVHENWINGLSCEIGNWVSFEESHWHWLPFFGLLITLAAAYRLAKFNIDERQTSSFIGLPTPASALVVLSLPLILNYSELNMATTIIENKYFLIVLTVVLCFLMNAEILLFSLKLKDYSWKNNKIKYSFILITAILCVALKFIAIPIVILIYVLLSIIENQFFKKDI